MLMCLNEMFKSIYTPSDYAMGFTEGRSVVKNANIHKGQNYVFNLDLKDFFPSIFRVRVRARLQAKPFNFNEDIAIIIAGLCSMKVSSGHKDGSDYVLPQGSPTSPIITNMICDNLDRRLAGLAKSFGLRYSRYADDITFSLSLTMMPVTSCLDPLFCNLVFASLIVKPCCVMMRESSFLKSPCSR